MKMGVILRISLLYIFVIAIAQVNSECASYTVCQQPRDIIKHPHNGNASTVQNVTSQQQIWWKIAPNNQNGNVLLAFKQFDTCSTCEVIVSITKRNKDVEIKSLSGQLGNFEILTTNVLHIFVNTTTENEESNTFTLKYYGDCRVVYQNPVIHNEFDNNEKCVIIAPRLVDDFTRIYMVIRNLILSSGLRLKVQDVHSSEVLMSFIGAEYYQVLAYQSTAVTTLGRSSFFVLVDLECYSESCNYSRSEYFISYYVLDENDISCIETQKLCLWNATSVPAGQCQAPCSAMIVMLEQEFIFETLPLLTESESDTMMKIEETLHIKKTNCETYWRFCDCSANATRNREYCEPTVVCLENLTDQDCKWRCIWMKLFVCEIISVLDVNLI